MANYRYEAVDAEGSKRTGNLEADSARTARAQLRTQKLIPLVVELQGGAGHGGGAASGSLLQREFMARPVISGASLAVWTRQMAGLVVSGLPLERALAALADEADKPKLQQLCLNLRSEVNAGSTFAKALQQHPKEFSLTYHAVVAAGEQSGQLDMVLQSLADDLESQQNLKAKVMAASLYPAIVSMVAIVIVIFLMSYVVPQVAQVFAGSKRELPILTVIMLAISSFIRNYGWYVLALFVLLFMGLRQALKNKDFRMQWDGWWLHAPLFGRLVRNYHGARFAATLSLLVSAGVPILKALQTASLTLGNAALRHDAEQAQVLVREGAPLASALAHSKRFPSLLPMFARLGEQTGKLPAMLSRAAAQLGSEVERRAGTLATVLEPLLIVGMGLVVMAIVLAVLMPIIELNQLVR